tara:strand:- start:31031 stop:31894 length:864 start_codon:yes stop_codon:yes gene_type:complete
MTDHLSQWTLVAEISHVFDLNILLAELDARQISYRVNRVERCCELWVEHAEQISKVLALLEAINSRQKKGGHQLSGQSFQQQLRNMPVVVMLLLLSIMGTAIMEWGFPLVHWFTFQDFTIVGNNPIFDTASNAMKNGEYWRLVTPIFLHFGHFHLVFNVLLLWVLGQKIEFLSGSLNITVSVILIAIISNLGQYIWSGPALFGGMSGVVYGLLGYVWIRHKLSPNPILEIPKGLIGFMLFWLFLGMSGVINVFMAGSIANAAHAAGLIAGMALGGWAGRSELRSRQQ